MFRRRRRRAPVSTLRASLSRRIRQKDDWDEFKAFEPEEGGRSFLPLAVLRGMHRYLAIKITVAVVVVLLAALLYRGGYAWGEPLLNALRYVTTAEPEWNSLIERAVPAFRNAWGDWELPVLAPSGEPEEEAVLPLPGKLASGYGLRSSPDGGGEEMHYGIDLTAPPGTAVQALFGGTVRECISGEAGAAVLLDHEEKWQTLYRGLAAVKVKEGDAVAAGQVLGSLGEPRLWKEPHLHFELRYDGRPVPPPAEWLAPFQAAGNGF